jgi:hypothetical protein
MDSHDVFCRFCRRFNACDFAGCRDAARIGRIRPLGGVRGVQLLPRYIEGHMTMLSINHFNNMTKGKEPLPILSPLEPYHNMDTNPNLLTLPPEIFTQICSEILGKIPFQSPLHLSRLDPSNPNYIDSSSKPSSQLSAPVASSAMPSLPSSSLVNSSPS